MARIPGRSAKAKSKAPRRITQLLEVFRVTRQADRALVWWMLLGFLLPVLAGVVVALLIGGTVLGAVVWVLLGVVTGLLVALIVLGRRAEAAAYRRIEGQPGAVSAVLRSSLRRGWRGSEMPVAVNPRSRDAVYRVVGRPGVVLIAEGPKGRTQRLSDEERRKVLRVAPNVPVHVLRVGPDDGAIPLARVNRSLGRVRSKSKLTRAEVLAVSNRLDSLGNAVPMPKGVDPTKLRPVRR